jgi:hypothetical protein
MLDEATKILLESQNGDGGWGAMAGKRSVTEPTALALLALKSRDLKSLAPAIEKSKRWLIARQNGDGSWPVGDGFTGSSWSTAFAMMALGDSQDARDRVIKAGLWALEQKGSRPGWLANLVLALRFQRQAWHLNPDLIGWSWTPRSFSWVEPTSYFITALKKLKPFLPEKTFQQRVEQGELMIYDRMCDGGGWNYGNAAILGEVLEPFPDVTAVALIALQDHREREENQMSLAALDRMAKDAGSGLALSWSAICYALYGKDSAPLGRLMEQRFAKTRFLGETKSIALAILALGNGADYFRV